MILKDNNDKDLKVGDCIEFAKKKDATSTYHPKKATIIHGEPMLKYEDGTVGSFPFSRDYYVMYKIED